jgi:hypothetical protein
VAGHSGHQGGGVDEKDYLGKGVKEGEKNLGSQTPPPKKMTLRICEDLNICGQKNLQTCPHIVKSAKKF